MVQVRLDMALCSALCFDAWTNISCTSIPRHSSDHNLLLLSCKLQVTRPSVLRFWVLWTTHADFLPSLKSEWVMAAVYGSHMRILMCMLKIYVQPCVYGIIQFLEI